mgnify:CR=1 FL=1
MASQYEAGFVFIVMALVVGLWLVAALGMKRHAKSKSFSFSAHFSSEEQADEVAEKLIAMPGVVEATLVYSEAVAYLKLDDKVADIAEIKALLKPS